MATSKPSRAASVAAAAPIPRLAAVIRTRGFTSAMMPLFQVGGGHYDILTFGLANVKHEFGQQHDEHDVNEHADVDALRGARAQAAEPVQRHGRDEVAEDAEGEQDLDGEQQAEAGIERRGEGAAM